MARASDDLEFSPEFVDEYYRLYNKTLFERHQPALATLTHALRTLLDSKCPPSQRLRLRVDPGRIKSVNRLLVKAQTPKYRPHIQTPPDIFRVVPDIVGTRVTCNTLDDVRAVVSVIEAAATLDANDRSITKPHEDWKDDYIAKPKDSGYRAINLIVSIPIPVDDRLVPITCEIQVRTLLQHAWGELTHEDTYKPGVTVPDLVTTLSKRMATTLAVLDEIAQDLRNELDKVEPLDAQRPPMEAIPAASTTSRAQHGAPSRSSVLAPSAVAPPPEAPPKDALSPLAPATDGSQLTLDSVKASYQEVYGDEPEMSADALRDIQDKMAAEGLHTPVDLELALRQTRQVIEKAESDQESVTLTAFGRIMAAIPTYRDEQRGLQELQQTFEELEEEVAREERFEQTYFTGREAFGTVVHVALDYALVQLPEGDKGILHVTKMKRYAWQYVAVRDIVHAGDTVRVRIIAVHPARRRIELELLHGERETQ